MPSSAISLAAWWASCSRIRSRRCAWGLLIRFSEQLIVHAIRRLVLFRRVLSLLGWQVLFVKIFGTLAVGVTQAVVVDTRGHDMFRNRILDFWHTLEHLFHIAHPDRQRCATTGLLFAKA